MPHKFGFVRVARIIGVLAVVLLTAACANKPGGEDQAGLAGAAVPGSQQDFVVNVGDRVFFESDSTELSSQARATLDKQAQWLQHYNRYAFTIEGHADERGTREYNIALGAKRAQVARDYLASPRAGKPAGFSYLGPVFRYRSGKNSQFLQAGNIMGGQPAG